MVKLDKRVVRRDRKSSDLVRQPGGTLVRIMNRRNGAFMLSALLPSLDSRARRMRCSLCHIPGHSRRSYRCLKHAVGTASARHKHFNARRAAEAEKKFRAMSAELPALVAFVAKYF